MINTNPNYETCQISDIKKIIEKKNYNLIGDVIEFGTFTGGSTKTLSSLFPEKTIFTIDHFQGLEKTNKNVPKDSDWIERAFALDNPLYVDNSNVPKSIDELLDKNRTLGGLATIGIASAVFGYETQTSIVQFKLATEEAIESLNETPPNKEEALSELESATKYANHVSEWGSFALTRIQRDKRKIKAVRVNDLLLKTIQEITTTFEARGIEFITDLEEVEVKTFPMDIETIFLNLLTNSYSACLDNNSNRKISVQLLNETRNERDGFTIIVADSGNGINEEFREIIWEALYTTKTDEKGNDIGTGLGLTIVQSIIDDLEGERKVENDEKLKGAKFTIWLPIKK